MRSNSGVVKFLRWIGWLVAGALVVAFAVANRASAPVSFDPLPFIVDLPVFAIAFAAAALGFAGGAMASWLGGHKWRKLARRRKHRVDFLEREVGRKNEPGGAPGNAPSNAAGNDRIRLSKAGNGP